MRIYRVARPVLAAGIVWLALGAPWAGAQGSASPPGGQQPSVKAPARARKLPPVDEAARDPSFLRFRNRLAVAVRRRDAAYVMGVLDAHVKLSFGGQSGPADFRTMWHPEKRSSQVWQELEELLALGGAWDTGGGHRQFVAPYGFARFPDDLDAFEHVYAVRKDVPVRAEPKPGARIIATLSYDIVKAEGEPGGPWRKVRTMDGKAGYVRAADVRSPIDYRAGFRKVRGEWKMVFFLAGD